MTRHHLKTLFSSLAAMLSLLLLLNVVVFFQQPAMHFFPLKELEQKPTDWKAFYHDVFIRSRNGKRIHGWFIPGSEPANVLLFLHGNGGNISHRRESLQIFNKLGLSVLIIDYQGYGESEGSPGEVEMNADAEAAWDYLVVDKKFKPENIVVFGRSLGGPVAARLAANHRPAAVILESSFSSQRDMAELLFPIVSSFTWMRYDFNTLEAVRQIGCPLLVVHSRSDEVVPFWMGRKIFEAANAPKVFAEIQGNHNTGFLASQPEYELEIERFLTALGPMKSGQRVEPAHGRSIFK